MICRRTGRGLWLLASAVIVSPIGGCASPEDGRLVGGGRGGDGGNYRGKPIHVPSKLDGSKVIPTLDRVSQTSPTATADVGGESP